MSICQKRDPCLENFGSRNPLMGGTPVSSRCCVPPPQAVSYGQQSVSCKYLRLHTRHPTKENLNKINVFAQWRIPLGMEKLRCLSIEILHALHAITSCTTSASHKMEDELTEQQCTILRLALLDGISLFFTGNVGTGKTKTLLKLYLQHF